MEAISLKLPQALLKVSDRCAKALGILRAEYIRRALERMNGEAETRARTERMERASRKVRKESMRVNAEFAAIERDYFVQGPIVRLDTATMERVAVAMREVLELV